MKNYATFNGRARRTEYWMFALINGVISLILLGIDFALGIGFLKSLYSLVVLVPSIAVFVRRLHDVNKSGWWLLIGIIPIIGAIWLFVLMVTEGDRQENQYGPNPKAIEAEIENA